MIGAEPSQLPRLPVSVSPTCAVPDTDGNSVFDGATVTTALAAELALTVPATLLALTRRRSVDPTSASTGA